MVLEVAVLNVRTGQASDFEAAFSQAQPLIAGASGYRRHELRRCAEVPERYLLLVWWDSIESHTEGFRGSPAYESWKAMLHHFYEPFPVVEHYESFLEGDAGAGADGGARSR
jgi:heme-degrading monooxygenase HmoA